MRTDPLAVVRMLTITLCRHGEVVKWVQTAAALEVVHAALGLV